MGTSSKKKNILLIEDNQNLSQTLAQALELNNFKVTQTACAEDALQKMQSKSFDAVLTDISLPQMNGLELLDQLQTTNRMLPVIVMTGIGTTDIAIEAIKRGAYDYLVKPLDIDALIQTIQRAIEYTGHSQTPSPITSPLSEAMVGRSVAMQQVYKEIGRLAPKITTVLILGPTGSGKELVARAIHQHSGRSKGPFIAINCASIPENLLESELFGHERGSFTGAVSRRMGCFEQANGGTLFLDEIGELTFTMQAKLLRVLQEKKIQRIGSSVTFSVDVRIIAATHCNLQQLVKEGKFRQDLYFRLNTAEIHLPTLQERKDDIPLLVQHFLSKHGKELKLEHPSITPDALEMLCEQEWPGNVRQLENVVHKALILSQGYPITPHTLAQVLTHQPNQTQDDSLTSLLKKLWEETPEQSNLYENFIVECERRLLEIGLQHTSNKSELARRLGVSRVTLREKLKKAGLEPTTPESIEVLEKDYSSKE
jgi:DNA-binding NtrC family response regulator